jgi:hypothetical protein
VNVTQWPLLHPSSTELRLRIVEGSLTLPSQALFLTRQLDYHNHDELLVIIIYNSAHFVTTPQNNKPIAGFLLPGGHFPRDKRGTFCCCFVGEASFCGSK